MEMPRKSAAELEVECLRLLAMDPHSEALSGWLGGKQSLKPAQVGMPVRALNKDRALHRG